MGGSSLADFNSFMDKLQDFPDDEELAPFLDEIAEDLTCQRNPQSCLRSDGHNGFCTGHVNLIQKRCKTFGCMMTMNHDGDCRISAKVGPRC